MKAVSPCFWLIQIQFFVRKQDLYNIVFLSPFNLSDPCWITPVEVNRALEAWSDCGLKYPLNVTTQVLERGSEEQKSCDRRTTASPATRNSEEVRSVVPVLAAGKVVAAAQFTICEVFQQNRGQRRSLLLTEQVWSPIWGRNLCSFFTLLLHCYF